MERVLAWHINNSVYQGAGNVDSRGFDSTSFTCAANKVNNNGGWGIASIISTVYSVVT